MRQKFMKYSGITLISLVITIVILLILAAIAVNLTTGENGIIVNTKAARKRTEIARYKEELEIQFLELTTDNISEGKDKASLQQWIEDVYDKGIIQEYSGETHWVYSEIATITLPTFEKGEYPVVQILNKPYKYYLKPQGEAIYIDEDNKNKEDTDVEEIVDGTINFSETVWEDNEGTVIISTDDDNDYQFEYKVNDATWEIIEGKSKEVMALQSGDKIVARLLEIDEEGNETVKAINSKTIIEEKLNAPELTLTEEENGENYTVISVQIGNEEVMPDTIEYTYYIKKSSEKEFIEVEKIDSEIYEFSELTPNTKYDIKVTSINEQGEQGEGTITIQTYKEGEEEKEVYPKGTLRGAVYFRNYKWNPQDGTAKVQIYTYRKAYKVQYQINGELDGNWTTADRGVIVENLKHGDIVYARVTNGEEYGIKTYNKKIEDKVKPYVSTQVSKTDSSMTLSVYNVRDTQSGIQEPIQYKYTHRNLKTNTYTELETSTKTTETITGLQSGYHSLIVEVTDRAGNIRTTRRTVYISGETHYITYNANGGTDAPAVQTAYDGRNCRLAYKRPKREGYKFIGWSLDGTNNGNVYNAGSLYAIGKEDVTFYAVWEPVMATKITLNSKQIYMQSAGNATITATLTPSTAINNELNWTSSNTNIATVTGNGLTATINAKNTEGNATITATTTDGSNLSASCTVTVTQDIINTSQVSEYPNYIVVEVDGFIVSGTSSNNSACLNEIDLYDSNSNKISYSIMDVYDSGTTSGRPSYWNREVWQKTNLYDGQYSYSSSNSTIFLYPGGSNKFARILIQSSTGIAKIRTCIGGLVGRTPKVLRYYSVDNYSSSTYANNIVTQNNNGLTKLYEYAPTSGYASLKYLTWAGYK